MPEIHASGASALAEQNRKDKMIRFKLLPLAHYEAAQRTLRKVKKESPVDRGDYKMGWKVKVKGIRVKDVILHNDSPHAGIIELGTRPFWPPLQPLIDWAERKAGDLALSGRFKLSDSVWRSNKKTGRVSYKGRASLSDDDREAVYQFAVGVQRKIAHHGLPARYIMKKSIPYTIKVLDRAVKRLFRKLVDSGGVL